MQYNDNNVKIGTRTEAYLLAPLPVIITHVMPHPAVVLPLLPSLPKPSSPTATSVGARTPQDAIRTSIAHATRRLEVIGFGFLLSNVGVWCVMKIRAPLYVSFLY